MTKGGRAHKEPTAIHQTRIASRLKKGFRRTCDLGYYKQLDKMDSQRRSTRVKAPVLRSRQIESTDTHEGLVLKPPVRPKPDIDDNGLDKFVRRKIPFIISTFNVKTLLETAKKEELAHEAQLCGIDIICLQEHRNVHSEFLQHGRSPVMLQLEQ